jgi:hypothetical protein
VSDNVIHVRFGPGGGRRVDPPREEPARAPLSREARGPRRLERELPEKGRSGEPYGELFDRAEVARLFELPESRLAYWARSGFIKPSGKVGRRRYYTFQDLIGIRAAM